MGRKGNRFGFILHYESLDEVVEGYAARLGMAGTLLRSLPPGVLKRLMLLVPPFPWFELGSFRSRSGSATEGFVIACPFIPEHVATSGEERILRKLIQSVRLAERLGAKIVGLAGFTSVIGNGGEHVGRVVQVPVTSGNTYTAALVIQGIRRAADLMGVNLSRSTLAVIGATGDIGSACSRIFAEEVAQLNLAARREPYLREFAGSLHGRARVVVKKYVKDAVRDADIIVTVTSAITTLIEAEDVKPRAIVCDVAIPHNVALDLVRRRDDVLAFEGGLAKLPGRLESEGPDWQRFSPDGQTIYGCLAETMLLALEERWESFSVGRGNITQGRIHEISQMASRHGIALADFRYDGKVISDDSIRVIAENARRGREQELIELARA